jgi:hypothetical protein
MDGIRREKQKKFKIRNSKFEQGGTEGNKGSKGSKGPEACNCWGMDFSLRSA